MRADLGRRFVAELVGTALLVAVVVGSGIAAQRLSPGDVGLQLFENTVTGIQACELPAVPEMLAPLFEIVPVQVAALRMAELRGIPPGSFRYAPQVAVDEATFGQRQVS